MLNAIMFLVNQADLTKSLDVLWKGLLAIVVVVGIIMIVTAVMQKISYSAAERKKKKDDRPDADKKEKFRGSE